MKAALFPRWKTLLWVLETPHLSCSAWLFHRSDPVSKGISPSDSYSPSSATHLGVHYNAFWWGHLTPLGNPLGQLLKQSPMGSPSLAHIWSMGNTYASFVHSTRGTGILQCYRLSLLCFRATNFFSTLGCLRHTSNTSPWCSPSFGWCFSTWALLVFGAG